MAYFNDKMAKKQPLLFIPLIHSHHLHPKTRTEVDFVFEKAYNSKKRSLNLGSDENTALSGSMRTAPVTEGNGYGQF